MDCGFGNRRVCVAGLGTVGRPTAEYILKQGFDVIGYDVDKDKVSSIKDFPAYSTFKLTPEASIYVICVSTGWKDDRPDLSAVYDVCRKISRKATDKLVSVESTVTPGACQRISYLTGLSRLVHVPHRYWKKSPVRHGVKQLRVIGGINQKSLEAGKRFYDHLGVPLHPVANTDVAEMIKVVENAYRYVHIAFAEECKLICDRLHLDFDEVRDGANTKWNTDILEAREGIGGECLPKDTRYLISMSNHAPLLEAALRTDALYRKAIDSSRTRDCK